MNHITAKINKEKEDYTIIASTKDVDRDGEIVLPSAFKNLDQYLNINPVILAFHDHHSFPIGKAKRGYITENDVRFDIMFAETERGIEAKYLFDNGFMNTFSIGFIPKDYEINREGVKVYTDIELLEISAVPIPSNRSAAMLRQAEQDGIKIKYFGVGPTSVSEDVKKDEDHEINRLKAFVDSVYKIYKNKD